ncbi:hypothetical protein CVT24_009889 [Panaeolus cyanescens]|uniref:F-box domain-containing protein n=1 Tax=Panaeolus cyanescens TaxID=181874 RepID=A0A409WWA7_9AGAR|nr:hypothetical protein CVT24_009889 [Panaeolus cyanescens]
MASLSWHALPIEMKWSIIDTLDEDDVKSLSMVDQKTYQACVPARFKNIKLDSVDTITQFIDNVPRSYCEYIQHLDICTRDSPSSPPSTPRTRSDHLITLLSASPRLHSLTLRVIGTLDKSIVAPFPYLTSLRRLSIANCGDEHKAPL